MNTFVDLILSCCACGTEFLWSARDQEFFQEQAYSAPRRCRGCRALKRQRFETMGAREIQAFDSDR